MSMSTLASVHMPSNLGRAASNFGLPEIIAHESSMTDKSKWRWLSECCSTSTWISVRSQSTLLGYSAPLKDAAFSPTVRVRACSYSRRQRTKWRETSPSSISWLATTKCLGWASSWQMHFLPLLPTHVLTVGISSACLCRKHMEHTYLQLLQFGDRQHANPPNNNSIYIYCK